MTNCDKLLHYVFEFKKILCFVVFFIKENCGKLLYLVLEIKKILCYFYMKNCKKLLHSM